MAHVVPARADAPAHADDGKHRAEHDREEVEGLAARGNTSTGIMRGERVRAIVVRLKSDQIHALTPVPPLTHSALCPAPSSPHPLFQWHPPQLTMPLASVCAGHDLAKSVDGNWRMATAVSTMSCGRRMLPADTAILALPPSVGCGRGIDARTPLRRRLTSGA